MDRVFRELIESKIKPFNEDVVESLVRKQSVNIESYIHAIFTIVSEKFPEGLKYHGYERCTPEEEWAEITRPKNNRRQVEMSRSDIYMVKYNFSYEGVELPPRNIYLPFVGDAGEHWKKGSRSFVLPVLNDRVISPENKHLFVRLLRDKVVFNKAVHSVMCSGERITTSVIYSQIYRKKEKDPLKDRVVRAQTCLGHYLFARFGFKETFEKYVKVVPIIGLDEINQTTYPPSHWLIYQSSGIRPKTYVSKTYLPNRVRIAIPLEYATKVSEALIASAFYVIDHFPERFTVESLRDANIHQSRHIWSITLGRVLFSPSYTDGHISERIQEHFSSIDEYVDDIVATKLLEEGYVIEDFYDFMILIMRDFNDLVIRGYEVNNSLYGKELSVLYYLLYPITSKIFKFAFQLSKDSKNRHLTMKDIVKTMNLLLNTRAIQLKTTYKGIFQSAIYSGDNMVLKYTSMVVPQADATENPNKPVRVNINDPMKRFHISFAEAGGYLYLPKSNPTGSARVNPYVNLSPSGVILKSQDSEIRSIIDKTYLRLTS